MAYRPSVPGFISYPATVSVDDLVDFLHEADGLVQGDDDLLVMGDVFVG